MPGAYLLSAEVAMMLLGGDDPEAAPLRTWMEAPGRGTLYVSAIGLAWIRSDIEAVEDVARRGQLKDELERTLEYQFEHRKLHLDDASLRRWASIRYLEHEGATLSTEDALEVSLALANDLVFVGRHSELRAKAGITIDDPFTSED